MISLTGLDQIEVGDLVSMHIPNRTRLNRFLFWLFKRPIPDKLQTYKISAKHEGDMEIEPLDVETTTKELPAGCKGCQSTFPCEETCGADPF